MNRPLRIHGGPDAAGPARHDFSTNANACGPCPQAVTAVEAADRTRYPDPAYTRLRSGLASFHGVEPARVVIAASASDFIFRITGWAARRGVRAVGLPPHAYGDYAAAARAWGLAVGTGPAAFGWSCEPSSPLGQQDGDAHARVTPGGVLVLDRAYEPLRLAGAPSMDPEALQRCWQLWSPNKALGLTGVRAAYAIAPAHRMDDADALEALTPSWALGAEGVALLTAWCASEVQHWLEASRATLRGWKERQQALCQELGWRVLPSCANFFVAAAAELAAALPALRARGILLRDCASFGLPGHVRLAVQSPQAQDALASAWRQLR